MLIIDEKGMVSADILGQVDAIAKQVVHNRPKPKSDLDGIPIVVMVGYDYKLPLGSPDALYCIQRKVPNRMVDLSITKTLK